MFHLFRRLINCPCNEEDRGEKKEKKKKRKRMKITKPKVIHWEDYTTVWPESLITDRPLLPASLGLWKILPLFSQHPETHFEGQCCLQSSKGLCHLITTQRQMVQLGNDLPGGRINISEKVGLFSLVPRHHQPVTTTPH